MSRFLIFSPTERLFWSNVDGWVDPASATRFSREEVDSLAYIPGPSSRWVEDGGPEVASWTDPDDELPDDELPNDQST